MKFNTIILLYPDSQGYFFDLQIASNLRIQIDQLWTFITTSVVSTLYCFSAICAVWNYIVIYDVLRPITLVILYYGDSCISIIKSAASDNRSDGTLDYGCK